MNRIDRISAILIQLQSRRVVKAADIAERFNISLRTVYRDVKTLEEAGVPLIGEAGVGYSIVDGYRLPPVMFTREEATAFLTAEKFVEKMTDASTIGHHQSAMYKIRAILRTAEKDLLEDMDGSIEVLKSRSQQRADNQDHIQTILTAIAQKCILKLDYFALHSQMQTLRDVEPVGIYYLDSFWHLIAYCRMRNDYRDFRLDRIRSISLADEKFTGQHPILKDYIAQTAREHKLETVVMRVDRSIHNFLDFQKYYNGFVSEKTIGDCVEMTFLTTSLEGFARWFMMYGDQADIISPDSLRKRVKTIASEIAKKDY
ncbi:YafY family transcriptional regulator [Mucilaginibacter limnophilus]|uniref:YafY family transcriptional regulator n=1 Tax=Mucilaginibacter limnophilus TaxID=1932778 RepID=A0A3S2UP92_9SPHI|nr:YafY family protein [Mucilaginibacter limnophilus]RVU02637.1 YafY family transcriptional regulator [Mucilaginibacter limnophilus]